MCRGLALMPACCCCCCIRSSASCCMQASERRRYMGSFLHLSSTSTSCSLLLSSSSLSLSLPCATYTETRTPPPPPLLDALFVFSFGWTSSSSFAPLLYCCSVHTPRQPQNPTAQTPLFFPYSTYMHASPTSVLFPYPATDPLSSLTRFFFLGGGHSGRGRVPAFFLSLSTIGNPGPKRKEKK